MENKNSWKPIHHAIEKVIRENKEKDLLSYELMTKLQDQNLISRNVDMSSLIEKLDDAIWAHEEALAAESCGVSLPMRLSRVI